MTLRGMCAQWLQLVGVLELLGSHHQWEVGTLLIDGVQFFRHGDYHRGCVEVSEVVWCIAGTHRRTINLLATTPIGVQAATQSRLSCVHAMIYTATTVPPAGDIHHRDAGLI